MNNDKSFISLNEFHNQGLANQTLLEADGDDGPIGNIIDRGLSFIPRAARFRKAKGIMRSAIRKFIRKGTKLADKFSTSFAKKVATIDSEYKELLDKKIKPLLADGKTDQAVTLMDAQKKELEQYKTDQLALLSKGIDDVLSAYTQAIDKRIDSPGFVFNVELSEKGKGELRAKWQELTTIAKMKIDEKKTSLIKSPGWKRLNELLSEAESFVTERKYTTGKHGADFHILSIKTTDSKGMAAPSNTYFIKTYLKIPGARPRAKERGLIWGSNPERLELSSSVGKTVAQGVARISDWTSKVSGAKQSDFIRPYLLIADTSTPIYGDIAQISDLLNVKDEDRNVQNAPHHTGNIVSPTGGKLENEETEIPQENK